MASELTIKQEKFAQLYVELGSASEAYRRAYDKPNLDPSQSSTRAYELLQNSYIAKRVEELRERLKEKHDINKDKVIQMLLEVINDADCTFELAKIKEASKDDSRRLYRMAQLTKNSDKLKAIETLIKILGFDKDDDKPQEKIQIEIINGKGDIKDD